MTDRRGDAVVVGRVRTMCHQSDVAEAIAWRDGRITAVGDESDVLAVAGPHATVFRLKSGQTVLPGFIDGHVHLDNTPSPHRLAQGLSLDELLGRIRRAVGERAPAAWFVTRAYLGPTALTPSRWDLDSVSGDSPVAIISGFNTFANSKALSMIGIDRFSPDPLGGRIWRREHGEPTGRLSDTAAQLIDRILPPPEEDVRSRIGRGLNTLTRSGITTAHQIVNNPATLHAFQALRRDNELAVRMGLIIRAYGHETKLSSLINLGIETGFGDDWLRIQGVKFLLDGSLPDGAAFDQGDHFSGVFRTHPTVLHEMVAEAHAAGLRCFIHANGDASLDIALNAIESALAKHPATDHRHRIEHAGNSGCSADRIERMKRLGVVAVPNPTFLGRVADKLAGLPERPAPPVNIESFLRTGAHVAVGSDFPGLGPAAPLQGIRSLLTRGSAATAANGLVPHGIDRWTAVSLYTRIGAWLGFEEGRKGVLAPGCLADFVVLSNDPVTSEIEDIDGIDVLATFTTVRVDILPPSGKAA